LASDRNKGNDDNILDESNIKFYLSFASQFLHQFILPFLINGIIDCEVDQNHLRLNEKGKIISLHFGLKVILYLSKDYRIPLIRIALIETIDPPLIYF
jgi:hypothetical protein